MPAPPTLPELTDPDTELKYFATRYEQGGRVVYAFELSPHQLQALLPKPDPDRLTPGNRRIRLKHAERFAKYVRERSDWVSPAMILRAPDVFEFEKIAETAGAEFGVLAVERAATRGVEILDGQHRTLGFHLAAEAISADLDIARDQLAHALRVDTDGDLLVDVARARLDELLRQRKRLANDRISVQIFIEDHPQAYQQMFFDIADNALGITASVKARFDNRKVVNRALESVVEHPLLHGRVDLERDQVGRDSAYLITAKQVRELTQAVVVGLDGRVSKIQEQVWRESQVAAQAKGFLNLLLEAFIPLRAVTVGTLLPEDLRRTSLLGSSLMLRVLAGAYHDLLDTHRWTERQVAEYFTRLARHLDAPVSPGSIWLEHTPEGTFAAGRFGPSGRRQDLKALRDAIRDWALEDPDFVAAAGREQAP